MSVNVGNHEGLCHRRKAVHGESFDPSRQDPQEIKMVPKTVEQRKTIEESLRKIFMFQNLDQDQFDGAVTAFYEKRVSPGENVITIGEEGKTFYIIQAGSFKSYVLKDGKEWLDKCQEDRGYFGELNLLYGEPSDMRVTAATDGVLWCLDRKTYRQIVLGIRARKLAQFNRYLGDIPSLSKLTPRDKNLLASLVETLYLNPGQLIAEQGERQKGVYVLLKGSLKYKQVLNSGDTAEWTVDKTGLHFGDKCLVSKCWWPYSILAETKVEVAYLSLDAVETSVGSVKR